MVPLWWNNISKISNITGLRKMVIKIIAHEKQKGTRLMLCLEYTLNHNKTKQLYTCTSNPGKLNNAKI